MEDEARFVQHNVEHILENRLEDISICQNTPKVDAIAGPGSQNATNQLSRGDTPMKAPKGLGEPKPVNENTKKARKEKVDGPIMIEMQTTADDRRFFDVSHQISDKQNKNKDVAPRVRIPGEDIICVGVYNNNEKPTSQSTPKVRESKKLKLQKESSVSTSHMDPDPSPGSGL